MPLPIISNMIALFLFKMYRQFMKFLKLDKITQNRPQDKSALLKITSNFSTKTFVVGTQKNRLNGTVLLDTQNTCLN